MFLLTPEAGIPGQRIPRFDDVTVFYAAAVFFMTSQYFTLQLCFTLQLYFLFSLNTKDKQ